jgi:hypothetical protein
MTTRIRTLTFLPEIFQTKTNSEFLTATLDQIVNPPITTKIEGYVGSKFGYGIDAKDYYVTEPTKTRTDYQLEPGVVFTKKNESVAQDFISYPGILDALKLQGAITDNNARMFESEIYSWDSFTDLDKLINFNQYYWLPSGPPAVTVSSAVVFTTDEYVVTDLTNGYSIRALGSDTGTTNPTITLLRGGQYRFIVNQPSEFWIQGEPGTTGFSATQPGLSVRDVFGVSNNGATQGVVTFNVPGKDAQNQFLFPGNNLVDVVSTLPFSEVNGARLVDLESIDGITSLNGLRVMFYNTGVPAEVGYVSAYYDEASFDTNTSLVSPIIVGISATVTNKMTLSSGTTDLLSVNNSITFNGPTLGGVQAGRIYYVSSIEDATSFTISEEIDGAPLTLVAEFGSMTANVNQGLFEEGFYTNVSENFYRITYVGDSTNPVLRLIPDGGIPTEQQITATYGTTWINRNFYRNTVGVISLVPYLTAPLDELYYQDGTSPNKVGVIRLIDSNLTNTINVERDILGKKAYNSTNGVVFTNGLKVSFDGDVVPSSYLNGEYYVEGVGTAIELIPVQDLVCPEPFTTGSFVPYSIQPYDIGNYDGDLFVPTTPDYITIARNAINKNAWSRSNRWFHIDVIDQTATYNNNSNLITELVTAQNKAKRPIIEFYPNLKLFDTGTEGKNPVDFIDTRTADALSDIAGLNRYYPDVEVYTANTAAIDSAVGSPSGGSTTITIPTTDIVGTFQVGQYVADYLNILPRNTQITSIDVIGADTELTVSWTSAMSVGSATQVAIIGSDISVDNYSLFSGARIIFAADTDPNVRNKIYTVNISSLTPFSSPVVTLSEAFDSECKEDNQVVILRGYDNQGKSYYFDGDTWKFAQEKKTVNQPPLFDVFDSNGISFGNADFYQGTSFIGNKLFAYGIGTGANDSVLGFPVRYSAIDNVGDINFDVSLNTETFDYVTGASPITQKVNTGYVFNYGSRTERTRELGWQTAVANSTQYQLFEFNYSPAEGTQVQYTCDIAAISQELSDWPVVQVYINNACQSSNVDYTVTSNSTTVTLNMCSVVDTVVQILVLSNQVSSKAYYTIPVNLNNNPLNQDLETVNIGDIRTQYRDIYVNAPGITGLVFGANNFRDLGNLVPYGTKIIQNSASLVLPGVFLRKTQHSLFDALMFNSREYVKFKALLVDTINSIDYTQRFAPADILDQAMDIITAAKSEAQAFFWSDMLPSKAPYRSNTYNFKNDLETSIFPLSQVYSFDSANYNGVLVYLSRTIQGVVVQKQLFKNQDYIISSDAPSLTVTLDLIAGDKVTIKEYNQTYGSYVPNTPAKLGLYPLSKPEVLLDSSYSQPTYFIKGHDGSYNKLYGSYDTDLGILEDFRDQGLLEFELRVYNNIKVGTQTPIQPYEIVPGFFRDTDYSYAEFVQMYTENFLNWVGQNRLEYKIQFFTRTNEYTYNYTNSGNKLDGAAIEQGYWRGVYQYFYDTTTPNATPWQMLGFTEQPNWWTERYGPAPYTSDNAVLWNDLEQGIVWNDNSPVIVPSLARPGLSKIIPVDSAGKLTTPFKSIVGNYNPNTFQKDWKVGDVAPVELSYQRSSSYPFDLMKLYALMKPAKFFNLGVDLDNYKYNQEFNQYLVNDRSHLVISDIEIYGNGIAKTSYINWIVDFEKQLGITATQNLTELLDNLDVRLVYRLAGYSDKDLLKFYVEKGTPNSRNASLLIPDESYSVLLYDNQPFDRIAYSSVVVQLTQDGYSVFGNSQTNTYFKTLKPLLNGNYNNLEVENATVKTAKDYTNEQVLVPYGAKFYSQQEVAQFLASYSAQLRSQGMLFDEIVSGIEINWDLMIGEFLYWSQMGWEVGSIVSLNPAATILKINKESAIVQPLTVQQTNFILNQNLYPIQAKDMCVFRNGTEFTVTALNQGDGISYGQFNVSNFEHGVVFDNITLFNDVIYNLVTGLRQNRINLRGTKTAEWNGTINASGFIMNQDNIQEWSRSVKYTKGSIVLYKNRYWTALRVIEPTATFNERDWKETDYDQVQKGLLPNPSTRSYESTLYYDTNKANLENDADLLGFSLIGYRPRDYLALADLTDITQVNVYKNLIKNKGTRNAVEAFKGASLPQGGIDYDVYENWAIKTSEYGGLLNKNFVDFKINEEYLTGNPSIVSLTDGESTAGTQQEVSIYHLYNYARPIDSANVLSTIDSSTPSFVFPDAGYVNFNDVKMSSYFYSGLPLAVDKNNDLVSIRDFYVRDYTWLANYLERWDVLSWKSAGQIIAVRGNLDGTATITFAKPHNLARLQPLAIINYADNVDGYYTVSNVVNLTEVIINLGVVATNTTGRGIGLTFQSQRVDQPSDIANLPLLEAEFVKNTVWVDSYTDGSWAVLRKSLNYQYNNVLSRTDSVTFGTAVAYTDQAGYLISDSAQGKVYRYTKNAENTYVLYETLTENTTFGADIAYANNTYVISETSGNVYVYVINDSKLSNDMLLCQTISAPIGATSWGDKIDISGDGNWLYVSDIDNNKVHVYQKQNIILDSGYFNVGETYIITEVGDTDFAAISQTTSTTENRVGQIFVADATGTVGETGKAMQISFVKAAEIDGSVLGIVSNENFSKSLATNYYGDTIVVSAPNKKYDVNITNWGSAYAYSRSVQNIEVQSNTLGAQAQTFALAWIPTSHATRTSTAVSGNYITANASMTGFSVDDPVVFSGTNFGASGISPNTVYYIDDISGSTFSIKTTRSSTTPVTLIDATGLSFNIHVQVSPLIVSVNGVVVQDDRYGVYNNTFIYVKALTAGDIITVSGDKFTLSQTFTSDYNDRVGTQFGYSLDTTNYGTEILVGSPFEISEENQEGAVYRYTNGGGKFGLVIGTDQCNTTTTRALLINGYLVNVPAGNATAVANAINSARVTNVQAAASADNKLIIQLLNSDLAQVNKELLLTAVDSDTLTELGITVYANTQIITSPHKDGPTQFGSVVKFNESDSCVIAAPVATRFAGTTFDFVDDENQQNDTIFDNNATQFIDTAPNAGAVYMFDYLANANESLANTGKFVYAQNLNSKNQVYGFNPQYGQTIDFNSNVVVIGAPNFLPESVDGEVTIYENTTGVKDWSVYRSSSLIVDIDSIQNAQLYSAETNNTLINLDYIDPLQGKLLGSVRQNIDYVSSIDPASYRNDQQLEIQSGFVWGERNVGQLWFDTNNVRFVNYHQNDAVYNSKYWGTVFPDSDVAIYSWIASNVQPSDYEGPGEPKDISQFTVSSKIDASDVVVPVYYFWVRNTNTIFKERGKTLSDTILESYVKNPRTSGISFFAPLLPNTFALYNSEEYINANDSVLHIGYATGKTDDAAHTEYSLIRENFADDFLPGLPRFGVSAAPEGLYDRFLDSLAGVDEQGQVVPNPFLPKAVQSGILARPRQSFFYNRFQALRNYLVYANTVLAQFPIAETRREASFLFASGEFYDTTDYWQYTNWWALGYDDNTKSALQVPLYADLSTLSVPANTIVTVETNGDGKFEVYRYDGDNVWTRIGLENGTIEFKIALWDYAQARLGFGDNFFDTSAYDEYPSEETRYIVRALNEQLYIEELVSFRNKSLILMFEYIQSESTESQNYLPWLTKTSLVDVAHTIRELKPIEIFQADNKEFLAGYINEVKPYHVVIKEFLFKYTGIDVYNGNLTDFDLPAQYNSTVQQFITPALVYTNASTDNEYLPANDIWQTAPYTQWFQNKGVSITGQPDFEITTLVSYTTTGSTFVIVDNAQGFPINGVIRINDEEIAYSQVDRALNLLGGLTRGVNGTPITTHLPGDKIIIDLPEVVVLNGGRGYTEPPRITAYVDLEKYPAPTKAAELEAIMGIDSVISVRVVDPGQGYMVLPEIRIDPANVIMFSNTDVNDITHTIRIYAPGITTGDLVQFKVEENSVGIANLSTNQWYYVNVLEVVPSAIIALYTNYADAVNDRDRVKVASIGSTNALSLSLGARASAITSAFPVRENNTTLRFDRTSYTSRVKDWRAGAYYGSFFAGSYNNSDSVSSSSIQLGSQLPPISSILAGAQGVAFEITDVENDRQLTWSSVERRVQETIASTNAIRLIPLDDGSSNPNASGSTIGFYTGLPIKFVGSVVGGIIENQQYYVRDVLNDTDFTVSEAVDGTTATLTDATVPVSGLSCFTGDVIDTAVLTFNYPGILEVTATQAGTNTIQVPTSLVGTGGTTGFYTNLPVFFTGNVFGGILENDVYYVTTVVDSETFTISETQDPLSTTATVTTAANDRVTVSSTAGFAVNDPIIFTGTTFGGITAGTTYYVSEVVSSTQMTVSTLVNGGVFALSDDTGSMLVTSQANTVSLSSVTGSMTLNVSLPVSPGQIDGQLFTLYNSSVQYPNVSGTNGNLIERDLNATIATVNRIAIDKADALTKGISNFYVNMPVKFYDSPIVELDELLIYYVTDFGRIEIAVTGTSSSGNEITCDTTESLYVGMPIVFSGQGLGGIVIGVEYFIDAIVDSTTFTLVDVANNAVILTTENGTMTGAGDFYMTVSLTPGGSDVILSSSTTAFTVKQEVTIDAEFDVSYVLGGYQAIVSISGEGYAVDNTISITGDLIGGTTPANDLTLTVNTIDEDGKILDVICSGIVPDTAQQYYLKVISPNQLEVYSNQLMTVPVTGINFPYVGYTTTSATAVSSIDDTITLSDASNFVVNDAIVFTGNVSTAGGIIAGKTYYIDNVDYITNKIQISENPGDVIVTITVNASANFTAAKSGSFALLPEPFYFNQSIVKFNNRVYVCVISNNDDEFVFGKWELLRSDDRRLNAMDRAIGYYQPTANMPGIDLTQLFDGVTYPNSIYFGNPFAPANQYELDTALQPQPFNIDSPTYEIDGDSFTAGYAPEELVAGVVTDNIAMIVNTRPGTNWPSDEYSHTGYNVVSAEIVPENATQTEYSFEKLVQYPTELSVFLIDGTTDISTTLYEGIDYTIDWVGSKIILTDPIAFTPVKDVIRLDVYEVGNSDQLVKANTKTDPIRLNTLTGFNEIELNCNYSKVLYQGSGAIRPGTFTTTVFATATSAVLDSITCDSVDDFVVNGPIRFQGAVIGGLVENQQYFVKSISYATNSITISDSFNSLSGIAGPIVNLTDDTGTMLVNIESGNGLVWSDPAIYHNGVKLVLGTFGIAVQTKSSNNAITTTTTFGLIVDTPITFCQCMFADSNIDPLTTYYVHSIVSNTEFTISDTQGGSVKTLTSSTGRSLFITNDYAIGMASNGISAKLIFAAPYDNSVDYLAYTILGQTFPEQYGYTLPETQVFIGDGATDTFSLDNFVGEDNPSNAIVEVNGIRSLPSDYTINPTLNNIVFNTAPGLDTVVAVTTFNDTRQQYLNTQVDVLGAADAVTTISNISNAITPVLATTFALSSTAGAPNQVTVTSTAGFVEGQTVMFKGASFDANIETDGTVYFVKTIVNGTTFIIADENNNTITTAGGTGNMLVEVGGTPAVRITTNGPHLFVENDEVRIDDTLGSIQLNNNTYYAKVISSTVFDLYEQPYDPALGATNLPITEVSSYISGGYTWKAGLFYASSIAPFAQVNTDRLWVTVNGYRVPSSKLRLNSNDELSILAQLVPSDEVIITSMVPYATPDEETYINFVSTTNEASVYRANTGTRTWLTQSVYDLSDTIYVDDVTKLTNTIVQSGTAPAPVNGEIEIGLNADKRLITNVTVFNETTNELVSSDSYQVIVEELSPILVITDEVSENDVLTITILEGNLIYVNGEQIRFGSVDFATNTLSQLQRGVNGTGKQFLIPIYSEVYGLLSKNRLSDVYYNQTWNSAVFNTIEGDPLQISNTVPAEFLNSDII